MGYYSDVALATRKKWLDEMLRRAKTEEDSGEILSLLVDGSQCSIIGEGDDAVVILYWNFIKWYDEFRDVRYVEHWMEGAFDEEFEYAFIRIGEDDSDVDQRSSDDYDLCQYIQISRSIWIDDSGELFTPEIPPDKEPEDDLDLPDGSDGDLTDYLGA